MGYIYKIVNDINNKIYIGKTEYSIEKRFQEHINDSKKKYKNRPLYDAINKYGIKHFKIEQIEECQNQDLNKREKYWINELKTYVGFSNCQGYNATLGGDGQSVLNKEEIYNLWERGLRPLEISKVINKPGDINRIRDILCHQYGEDYICEEIKSRYLKESLIKIKCYDKDTKELIKDFNSIKDGAIWIKQTKEIKSDIKNIASFIGKCCKGKKTSAYGYKWEYN